MVVNMLTKTVAVVLNTSWNIYNFRLGLMKALQESGYKIIAIAPRDSYTQRLEDEGFIYYEINMNNKGTNPFEDFILTYNFYKLYKEIKPDILLHYTIKPNIYGSLAARILNIPVISNITGLGTVFLNSSLSSKIAQWLYKISLQNNSVFFQNRDDLRLFLENRIVKEDRIGLVPGSGINIEHFKSSKHKKSKSKKVTFLMVSRLIKDKGVQEYIEAIRTVRNSPYGNFCSFKLLGSLYLNNPTAISQEELNSWIDEGLIEYLGHSDLVKEEIDKVDCVVLPSYREGLSRVLLEAASMAKPIITTDVPGCRDIVEDGINGYLVKAKDSAELSDAIKRILLLSQEERESMGELGRKRVVNNFSEESVIKLYLSAVQSQLNPILFEV